jgi:hypothetical protein
MFHLPTHPGPALPGSADCPAPVCVVCVPHCVSSRLDFLGFGLIISRGPTGGGSSTLKNATELIPMMRLPDEPSPRFLS